MLPPIGEWQVVDSERARVSFRIPPGIFERVEGEDGVRLTSKLKAAGLGPGGADRPFAIRVHRIGAGVDALLASPKGSPLADAFLGEAFPKRTSSSFVVHADEPVHAGSSFDVTVAGRRALVWVNGVEGYNTDWALIPVAAADTLVVRADWNSSVMVGQPECWQRAIIGGVVDSLTPQ